MGDVPEIDESQEPTAVEDFARIVIAGHPRGSVRRIILYVVCSVAVVASCAFAGPIGAFTGTVAMIALLLLAETDQLA